MVNKAHDKSLGEPVWLGHTVSRGHQAISHLHSQPFGLENRLYVFPFEEITLYV